MYTKVLTVAAVCVVCVLAAPPTDVVPLEKQQPTVIPIVSQSEELEANGTYKFSYETGNGIKREEEAYEKVVPKAEGRSASSNEGGESSEDSREIHVQRGSYSYTAPDGTLITVSYIADENGFQPIGDHIPRVPSSVPSVSPEKSSKLVKPADSASSASEPKIEEKLAPLSASAPAPAAKPEEPPKEITTEKSEEAPEKPETEESTSESAPNSTPIQSTSAETTEAASTDTSNEKQTTANPLTEASQTTEAENASTATSVPSSAEELSTTTASS